MMIVISDWERAFDMGARISVYIESDHYGHRWGEVDFSSSDMLGELHASP